MRFTPASHFPKVQFKQACFFKYGGKLFLFVGGKVVAFEIPVGFPVFANIVEVVVHIVANEIPVFRFLCFGIYFFKNRYSTNYC
jgi:hypothetical protein